MNSKKSNQVDVLPPELAEAIAAAETVLAKHNTFATALAETGAAIPVSLVAEHGLVSKLGVAEIGGQDVSELRAQLDTIRMRREADSRRRQAAGQGLLTLEGDLHRVRELVGGAQTSFGAGMVADFSHRWGGACAELAALRAEAQVLGAALRTTVPTPPPFTATISPVTGNPEVRAVSAGAGAPPVLPQPLVALTAILDKLDAARGLVADLQQAGELASRYSALARNRGGGMPEAAGVYEVVRDFVFLGTKFTTGMLVNQDVVNPAMLHRFWQGRQIQPLVSSAMAAA